MQSKQPELEDLGYQLTLDQIRNAEQRIEKEVLELENAVK